MALKKGLAEATMRLRGRRYSAIVELEDCQSAHDVLDEWQSLYTPPEGADPTDMELESWSPLPERPAGLPESALKPNRSIRIWRSEQIKE